MGRVVIPGFRKIETTTPGEQGTTNYEDLTNKPFINSVPLVGNLKTVDLKLTDETLTEEGVPAEAKTVGTKLEEQSTSLTAVKEELTKKANTSDIPTKVSELQNDSNYQTDTDVTTTLTTYATKTYVGEQISSADHLKREIVTEIPGPETADKNTIYMLKIESATGDDKYKEYLLIDGTVQCIGDTSVDLTDYAKKTEIPTELPANGGNSLTVNGHTIKSDVPENAVFTDTIYDDAELQKRLSDNGYGEVAGGKNLIFEEIYGYLSADTNIHIDNDSTSYVFYANKGKHYTFSSPIEPTANGGIRVGNIKNKVPKDSEVVQDYQLLADKSFVANKTGYYFAYVYNSKVENVNVQIEEGSVATEYEPYFPSNNMLAEEKADKSETTVNLLNSTLQTTAVNGITCTNNGDGTYTLNGTADSNVSATFILKGDFNCSQFIDMKLVGCPSGAVVDGVEKSILLMEAAASPWNTNAADRGNGSIIVGPSENSNLFIRVYQGETVNNLVFKPMITTNLDATYDDFVPYTGDSGKLNSDVASLLKRIEALESITNKTDTIVTE